MTVYIIVSNDRERTFFKAYNNYEVASTWLNALNANHPNLWYILTTEIVTEKKS